MLDPPGQTPPSGGSVRGFCCVRGVKVRGVLVVLPLLGLGG
jgi:hypothetical protein